MKPKKVLKSHFMKEVRLFITISEGNTIHYQDTDRTGYVYWGFETIEILLSDFLVCNIQDFLWDYMEMLEEKYNVYMGIDSYSAIDFELEYCVDNGKKVLLDYWDIDCPHLQDDEGWNINTINTFFTDNNWLSWYNSL